MVAGFDGGAIASNAGALLPGATDRAIGLVRGFAACFRDARAPERIERELATLAGQRVLGIALGHEDLVDHDRLRHDPVLAVLSGKLEAPPAGCAPPAGKGTPNRLEHAPSVEAGRYRRIGHEPAAIEALFVNLFPEAHRSPPRPISPPPPPAAAPPTAAAPRPPRSSSSAATSATCARLTATPTSHATA